MLKMSFYDGTLDTEKAIAVVQKTEKKLLYRAGLRYRGAVDRPISREDAIKKLSDRYAWLDVNEKENEILINEFSSNDML